MTTDITLILVSALILVAVLVMEFRAHAKSKPAPKSSSELAMDAADQLRPLLDFAEGQRADLERRGFSPTVAEALAAQIVLAALSGERK